MRGYIVVVGVVQNSDIESFASCSVGGRHPRNLLFRTLVPEPCCGSTQENTKTSLS